MGDASDTVGRDEGITNPVRPSALASAFQDGADDLRFEKLDDSAPKAVENPNAIKQIDDKPVQHKISTLPEKHAPNSTVGEVTPIRRSSSLQRRASSIAGSTPQEVIESVKAISRSRGRRKSRALEISSIMNAFAHRFPELVPRSSRRLTQTSLCSVQENPSAQVMSDAAAKLEDGESSRRPASKSPPRRFWEKFPELQYKNGKRPRGI